MKITFNTRGYYITSDNINQGFDRDVAQYLNISYKEYVKILIKYGAKKPRGTKEYYFKTNEECKKFLNSTELEPYLIMEKLTEDGDNNV